MSARIDPADAERFRALITRRLGLWFEDGKLGFLAEVLRRRAEASGVASDTYLALLAAEAPAGEVAALARELTVGETYFLRNIDQFRAFTEVVLPDRLRAQGARRRLRFLSAGCASGEEAYSIAILLREHLPDPSWEASVLGVDVNPAALERARGHRFSAWALRETPPEVQRRWFRADGRDFVLDEAARTAVRFEARNLVENEPDLWVPELYDAIFCRNVLMYFTPEVARAVMERVARATAPGGYLFVGHAETLRGLSNAFHLRRTHGTFYYQRKERLDAPQRSSRDAALEPAERVRPLVAAVEDGSAWVEAIQRASDRIALLTAPEPAAPTSAEPAATAAWAAPAAPARAPAQDLGHVVDLLRRERFVEALSLVRALPPESARDPEVLLLYAVLLTHSGRLAEAESSSRELLALDDLHAGAHYVLALCREGVGDGKEAADHDQMAVYLDPTFAMPRLHLGLLARKSGERETAQRELGQALHLLQREDPSRLLLFGGGFGREALIALCRAEIVACGGTP